MYETGVIDFKEHVILSKKCPGNFRSMIICYVPNCDIKTIIIECLWIEF